MVMRWMLVACAVLGTTVPANAEPGRIGNKLGIRIADGELPIERRAYSTFSLGLAFDHRAGGKWHLFGDYELLWFSENQPVDAMMTVDHSLSGTGHRASAGFRRSLVASRWVVDFIRFHIDLEAGGGLGIASLSDSVEVRPHWLGGLHFGFTTRSTRRARSSTLWEFDILVRAIGTRDGAGVMGGLGMAWSD